MLVKTSLSLPGEGKDKGPEKKQSKGGVEIDASPATTTLPTPTPPATTKTAAAARKPKATYPPLASGRGHPPGLPPLSTLVAKRLTRSDLSGGRVILPRASVERNLPFMRGHRAWELPAGVVGVFVSPRPPPALPAGAGVRPPRLDPPAAKIDGASLVIKSWANGSETRRVYVLEGAARAMAVSCSFRCVRPASILDSSRTSLIKVSR